MKNYIYQMGPIDFWTGWSSINSLRSSIDTDFPYADEVYFSKYKVKGHTEIEQYFSSDYFAYASKIKSAIRLIKENTYWEGDGYIYVTAQPTDDFTVALCFAIKQGNNGSTFLCSDYELPNLSSHLVKVSLSIPPAKMPSKLPSLKELQEQIDQLRKSELPF